MKIHATLLLFALFFTACTTKPEEKMLKAILLTGNDHPAHKWEETTPAIKTILEEDSSIEVTVTRNPNRLAALHKTDYDFLVINYCNWKDPDGLSEEAKAGLVNYLEEGGGLIILHFSNGAFHFSLPGAGDSDWPEYRKIVHQVWDHNEGSTHDNYGSFRVNITDNQHFITEGIEDFTTEDELYFNQVGEEELPPLFTAVSVKSGKAEPLAWAYTYSNARIFQDLLGHSKESYQAEEHRKILKRAAIWVCGKDQ